ncbi:hypothetical protein C8R46DRAFT_824588, partial [Mycena filopes]
QLNRLQLIAAANEFGLDSTGTNIVLRALLKDHLNNNEDLMDNPDYRPLFSRAQRTQYEAYPAPWGGIETTPVPEDPDESGGSEPDFDEPEDVPAPPTTIPEAGVVRRLITVFPHPTRARASKLIPAVSSNPRRRPARVAGSTTSVSGHLIPEPIRKKFIDGWKSHVPLNYLVDKYCEFANHASTKELNDMFTMDSSSGSIFSVAKELPVDNELELTFDEWFQAWGRLLQLIKSYVPEEHAVWLAHHERIMHFPSRSADWDLLLDYDSQIRRRALNEDFDPSVFQDDVWRSLQKPH